MDINLPSWTTLAAEATSDDEDLNLPDLHTTILKPAQKDSTQQGMQGESHYKVTKTSLMKPKQPQMVYHRQVAPTGPAAR